MSARKSNIHRRSSAPPPPSGGVPPATPPRKSNIHGRKIASTVRTAPTGPPRKSNIRARPAGSPQREPLTLQPSSESGFIDQVRALIRDGQPSYATQPYGLVRQEQLTQQIPVDGDATTFYVLFSQVPLGKNVPVFPVADTIAAYVDGSGSPQTIDNAGITADIDANGNFTLAVAPTSSLLVTYGWQLFADCDIYTYVDEARSWLQAWSDLEDVPDGMAPALTNYAAGLASQAIARQLRFPDVSAGEAKETLSAVAKGYEQDAKDFLAKAQQAREDYWTSADQPKQPNAVISTIHYPVYQPKR